MTNEIRFNRDEMRLLVLSSLYEKYYHGGTFTYFQTKDIFSDLLPNYTEALTGDLVYLEQKKMIECLRGVSERMPNSVMITVSGIDKYEDAMQKASDKLLESETVVPKDIESDLKAGTWDRVDEWLEKHPALVRIFSKLFASSLKGGLEDLDTSE